MGVMKKKILFCVLFLGIIDCRTVLGAPGDLDTSFGTEGIVITEFSEAGSSTANAVALQTDGMIIAAGSALITTEDLAMSRYDSDGSLDPGFDDDGMVNTHLSEGMDEINTVSIQTDGTILIAGCCAVEGDFAIARFNTDGSLDTTFGNDGFISTEAGTIGSSGARVFFLQEDGELLVAGRVGENPDRDFALARYNADGTLDTTFNSSGEVTTDFGSDDTPRALAVDPEGYIVVVGSTGVSPDIDMALVRYDPNGVPDSSFSSDGMVTTDFGSNDVAGAVSFQDDGMIVVAGRTGATSAHDFALARYNSEGSLDTTFGNDGLVTSDIGADDYANALALQEDGMILAGGESDSGSNDDFAIARYQVDGTLDSGFGTDGVTTTDLGDELDYAQTMVIQEDGRIVLAGVRGNNSTEDFGLVRYMGNTADLGLSLSTSVSSLNIDEGVTYTMTITNNGPDSAGGVTVTDTLPAEITLDTSSLSTTQGSCTGTSSLECNLGTLDSGGTATVIFNATASATGTVSNSALVSAQATDLDSSNNSSTAVVSVESTQTGGGCQLFHK